MIKHNIRENLENVRGDRMKALTSQEIREKFIEYFKAHGHTHVPSSSLIPEGKDLLFTNAGMNQFKNIFLGLEKPPYPRAVSVQKCFRATDLDQVGRTPRHHTFFEMLGNFSFGDYFKEEAIEYAWDFLTNPEHLGIPKDRLYVTVFEGNEDFDKDIEAYEIWKKYVPEDRIKWCGAEDNFWRMASTGPCGPCSEIFYHYGGQDVEIWNLVFMQYNQISPHQRERLPKPCVDTGAGLERLTAVMQGVDSNFETDIFMSIFHYLLREKITKDIINKWKGFSSNPFIRLNDQQMSQSKEMIEKFLKDLDQKVFRGQQGCSNYSLGTNDGGVQGGDAGYLRHTVVQCFERILPDLRKTKNPEDNENRQRFIDFLCDELQKDRSLTINQQDQIRDPDKKQKDHIALLQIADHIRAIVFLLDDGAMFSNESRGYIIRTLFNKVCECLEQIGLGLKAPFRSFFKPEDDNSAEYGYLYIICYLVEGFMETCQKRFVSDQIIFSVWDETKRYEQEKEKQHQEIFNKAFEKKFNKDQKPTPKQIGAFAFECYETYGISKDDFKTYLQQKNINFDKDCEEAFEAVRQKAQDHSRQVSQQKYLTEQKEHLTKLASLAKQETETLSTELSGSQAVRQSDKQLIGESSNQATKQVVSQTNRPSGNQTNEQFSRQTGQETIRQTDAQIKKDHFVGYETLSLTTQVLKLSDGQQAVQELAYGQSGFVFFQQTPFYAESGGQIADQGFIKNASGQVIATVTDCQKYADMHCHHITVEEGKSLKVNDNVQLDIDKERRAEATKHHTATHLLYASLKKHLEVLVDEKEQEKMEKLYGTKRKKAEVVMQRGSYVADDHLRFDFTYSNPLSSQQKQDIEQHINAQIAKALSVEKKTMSLKEAKDQGALAFFGEKYPQHNARVISIGKEDNKESIELCGGTHVTNTNEIQAFVITQEENISAGVRRIKAIAGQTAIQHLLEHNKQMMAVAKVAQTNQPLDQYVKNLQQNNKALQRQNEKLTLSQINIDQLMEKSTPLENTDDSQHIQVFLETEDRKFLSQITDRIKDKLKSGVVIVFGKGSNPDKNPLLVGVTKSLTKQHNASQILKKYGVGGGRPDFAQGYYKQESLNFKDKTLNQADEKTKSLLQSFK